MSRFVTYAVVGLMSLFGGLALAQSPEPIQVDIGAQPVGDALNQFAEQSGLQVVLYADDAKGIDVAGVSGQFDDATVALDSLLASTGLEYSFINDRTVAVTPVQKVAEEGGDSDSGNGRTAGATPKPVMMAQASAEQSQTSRRIETDSDKNEIKRPLEEIIVTGTNIRGVAPIGSDVVVVDREEIYRSGFSSVQEVIQSIPQNSQAGAVSNFGAAAIGRGDNTTLATGINLRGLGARSSLTLVNGRRLAPGTKGIFVDVSTIPLSAIERVEVLADGASAIYGSDAVAGVVNFILRDDYEGAETSFSYRGTTEGGGRELQFSQLLGTNWETGNFVVGYEFTDRNSIRNLQRRATADCDLTDRGGDDFCSTQSNPGNISRIGSTPVSLAIPANQDGTSLDESDLIDGQLNTFNEKAFASLLPAEERHGVFSRASQKVFENVDLFAEAFYGRRDAVYNASPVGITLVVPESNAYRQLNGLFPGEGNLQVSYNLAEEFGPSRAEASSEGWRVTAGIDVSISDDWALELFGTLANQDEGTIIPRSVDTTRLNEALASSDLATSFNPFADGANTSQSVLDGINSGLVRQVLGSELRNLVARLDGSVLDLPGGALRLAMGVEYREEEAAFEQLVFDANGDLRSEFPGPLQPAFDRNIKAAFAEIVLPVVGDLNRTVGFEELTFSAALRVEEYSDFGTTTNPKFGFLWSPFNTIRFRGSYGTSFSVANLDDTLSPIAASVSPLPGFLDPLATDGSTNTLLLSGGNPDLGPEEGETFTVGFQVEPEFARGLAFGVNYFDVSVENAITQVSDARVYFANEDDFANAGLLIRNLTLEQVADAVDRAIVVNASAADPSQVELIIFVVPLNTGVLAARGLDFDAAYSRDTSIGSIGFSLRGSYLLELSQSFAPGLDPTRNEGRFTFPSKVSGRATVSWSNGPWSMNGAINHVAPYEDNLSTPARDIDAWTTVNAQISYRVGERGARGFGFDGTEISLSVINLFDTDPPFVNNLTGLAYDGANANPIGRQIGLRIKKEW